MKLASLILLAASASCLYAAYPNGCQHRTPLTAAGVSGTQSSYTSLILETISDFATVANGGLVQHTTSLNGVTVPADWLLGDSSATSLAGWDIINYSATTGLIEAYAFHSSLTNGNTIYAYYGCSSITTYQGNATSAYGAAYKGVWHFGTSSTLSALDSTSSGQTLTNTGSVGATTGQVGGAASFTGANYFTLGSNVANLQISPNITIVAWAKNTDASSFSPGYVDNQFQSSSSVGSGIGHSGPNCADGAANNSQTNPQYCNAAVIDGAWHQIGWTYAAGTSTLYFDGVSKATGSGSATIAYGTTQPFYIGRVFVGAGVTFQEDEVEILNTAQSSSWMATLFANQSSPGTFWTVGSRQDPPAGYLIIFGEFYSWWHKQIFGA